MIDLPQNEWYETVILEEGYGLINKKTGVLEFENKILPTVIDALNQLTDTMRILMPEKKNVKDTSVVSIVKKDSVN